MDKIKAFLKQQWTYGGYPIRIIALMIIIYFIYLGLTLPFQAFTFSKDINDLLDLIFVASSSFKESILKPWTLVTSIFMHGSLFHLATNVIVLFFAQRMFVPIFGQKRFLSVFFIGGIFGIMFDIAMSELLSNYLQEAHGIVGASGSAMAILMTVIAYNPKQKIALFGIIQIPLYVLGIVLIASDLIGLFDPNSRVAHFVHLGGAIIGFLAGYKGATSKNIFNWFSTLIKRKPKPQARKTPPRNDDDYVSQKRNEEDEINRILEKIKLKGYDSLSKKEKERLFTASKRK